MSNAVKCEVCGKFEEGLGYSVRIYKHEMSEKDGREREYAKKIVTRDHICSECAMHAAEMLNADLYGGE